MPQFIIKSLLICYLLLQSITAISLDLSDVDSQLMYSLGCITAENLKQQQTQGIVTINLDAFTQGVKDTLANNQQLTEQQIMESLQLLQKKQTETYQKDPHTSQLNLKAGQEFMAKNQKNKDIITLKSGLQYQVINKGNKLAKSPSINDKVQVQYRGTLLDGTEFDSSYNRANPTIFELKSLIPGWQQALILMKPNAKWKIFVPPQLAYGERGTGSIIGPNSVLIFDIELLAINPA